MQIFKIFRFLLIGGFIFTSIHSGFSQCASPISVFPYNEGFESNDGGWVPGGTASDWAWGTPVKPVISGAAAGNKCWVTGGLTGSAYNNGENSVLVSPCFDFSTLVNPQISFSIFWESEKRFDGANMEYSTDGGTAWILLGSINDNSCVATNWYNNASVNFLGGSNGWSGNIQPTVGSCQGGSGSGTWLTARHDLSFLAGAPKVIFRFRFGAGTTCNAYDGFAIDEMNISEAPPNGGDFTYTCAASRNVSFVSSSAGCVSSYAWDFADPASGVNNSSVLPNPTHTFSSAASYIVTLTINFSVGPPIIVKHTIEILDVVINRLISIDCNGNQTGAIAAFVTGGSGIYNYSWNTVPPQTTFDLQNIGAGSYTVTVGSATSCSTSATYVLTEPSVINPIITPLPATCGNNNGSITATVTGGTAPYIYNWSNGGTTPAISNLAPGNYSLLLIDANGCSVVKNNIVVSDVVLPVAFSLGKDTSICKGESLLLYPGIYSSYSWQDNSTGPTYKVTGTGKYWVRVTNINGCTGIDTINVIVDCSGLYFPQAFTPNDDKWNNFFGPLGNLSIVKNYTFRVYDRYGQLVFYSTNPYTKWDGTVKGAKYNTGAFAWTATYTISGQQPKTQQGSVLLLR